MFASHKEAALFLLHIMELLQWVHMPHLCVKAPNMHWHLQDSHCLASSLGCWLLICPPMTCSTGLSPLLAVHRTVEAPQLKIFAGRSIRVLWQSTATPWSGAQAQSIILRGKAEEAIQVPHITQLVKAPWWWR